MAEGMVSRRNDDGSVEAWLDGWHIRFPADGGEPSVSKGAAPEPLPPNGEAEVTISRFDSATFISSGDWVVELCESDFTVTPAQPEEDDENPIYYILE